MLKAYLYYSSIKPILPYYQQKQSTLNPQETNELLLADSKNIHKYTIISIQQQLIKNVTIGFIEGSI